MQQVIFDIYAALHTPHTALSMYILILFVRLCFSANIHYQNFKCIDETCTAIQSHYQEASNDTV